MWSMYCMQVTEVLAAKWVSIIQDCKRYSSPYGLPSPAKMSRLPLKDQQNWHLLVEMYSPDGPEFSPPSSRLSSPDPAEQKPQRSPRDLPPALLPPAAIPQEPTPSRSPLDIDMVRMLSIQGLSDEEESPREAGANKFFSPIQPTSPRASQPMSPSTLLAEADEFCGSLPSVKNYKEAHEEIAQNPELHIASQITTPNFKPHQPAQRRRMRKSAESPHRTPNKTKTAPAAADSTEKLHQQHSSPKAPHDIVSPLEKCVNRNAHSHNPRTYMLGTTASGGKLFLICEVTAKQSQNHKEIMDGVQYARVINELWYL